MINGKYAKQRLEKAGYVSHYEREACRWCANGTPVLHGKSKRVKCHVNGANVSCGGCCDRFAWRERTEAAVEVWRSLESSRRTMDRAAA